MDSTDSRGSCRWLWWFILLGPLALVLWWWLSPRRQCKPAITRAFGPAESQVEPQIPIAVVTAEPSPLTPGPENQTVPDEPLEPDDLTRIEGIGPKIASLCAEAGISTFAQLAETEVDVLREMLSAARLSGIANPTTWPEQAELAAAARWDDLAALQDSLKGGRRT